MAGKDYDRFEPSTYLQRYSDVYSSRAGHMLRCFYWAFQSVPSDVKVLDYGCGPSLLGIIPASSKSSEIVMSDYSENNIQAIRQWLRKDPAAFDWFPHFNFVVKELEGKGEEEVIKRQDDVRNMIKDVVHCDLTRDPLIETGYDQQYDVVICSLTIGAVAQTREEFTMLLSRMSTLIKSGGSLFLYVAEKTSSYKVGDSEFQYFSTTPDTVRKAMGEAGYGDVQVHDEKYSGPSDSGEIRTFFFVRGIHK